MAHELEFRDGSASMFSVKETPWHQHGAILADAPTFDDAMRLARLDYEVVRVPAHLPTGPEGAYEPSGIVFATMRTDTRRTLGRVGPDYEPVQNADAFGVLRPLIDSGVLALETGGVLRDGADAWLLGRWNVERFGPVVREVFADEVIPFSTICVNHSGRRGVLLGNTPIRIVCANTLGAAETSGVSRWETIRPTGDARSRMIEAAELLFGGVIERYEVIAQQYRALKAYTLTSEEFQRAVLEVIAPDPRAAKGFNPDAKLAGMVIERHTRKVETLTRLWYEGKGHTGDRSAWEAYNGAVEALDHDAAGLFPVRGGTFRTASLLDGTYARMKETVLDNVAKLAAA